MQEDLLNLIPFSRTLNVLYIEDNDDVRGQFIKLFNNFFTNVDIAENGNKGYKKYKDFYLKNKKHYDLVITDLKLPGINGIELCKRIIDKNFKQNILITSANIEKEEFKKKLVNIDELKYLQKPINNNDFLNTIFEIIKNIKKEKNI